MLYVIFERKCEYKSTIDINIKVTNCESCEELLGLYAYNDIHQGDVMFQLSLDELWSIVTVVVTIGVCGAVCELSLCSPKQVKVYVFKSVSNYNEITYIVLFFDPIQFNTVEYEHVHNDIWFPRETKLESIDQYTTSQPK